MEFLKLFGTAFIQVYLVAISTVCLANSFYIGVALMGFFISFTWTFNVSKIAICTIKERIIYSSGACIGSLLGLITTKIFI
jgi:hypothetical protein